MPQILRTEAEAIELEPLTVRIPVAIKLTGLGKPRIYELIQSGDLKTIKVGRSTLIPYQSLKDFFSPQTE